MNRSPAQKAEWIAQARRGVFQALAYHRRRLQSDEPLDEEARKAMVDLLYLLEEYVEKTWVPDIVGMTQQASDRLNE